MKILFLSHYGDMLGANRSLLSLVQGMMEKGVEPMVWCNKMGSFVDVLKEKQIPHRVFPYYNWADTFLYPGFWLLPWRHFANKSMLPKLVEAVRGFAPDIIHTNSSVLPIGAFLSEQMGIAHVWHIREMARLHYNMRFFPSANSLTQYLKKASQVVVISNKVREVVIGEAAIDSTLVYNGIMTNVQLQKMKNLDANPYTADRPFVFLIIGMIHPQKGQMLAVDGLIKLEQKHPNVSLHIVGSGRKKYTYQLKQKIQAHNLNDKILLKGYLANPEEAFRQADAVLMCSSNEGMGRVTVEAMAYGKPVIGLHSGATPELIEDGKDGFLFQNGAEELARCMEKLVLDPTASVAMGRQGQVKVEKHFTTEKYCEQMYTVFESVLKNNFKNKIQ